MNQKLKLKHTLITFKLCPFSMRVTALMCHKNIKFEIKFIEMHNKPDWFMKLSPLGKVPILIVGEDGKYFKLF
jgi:glutathione S-transferase